MSKNLNLRVCTYNLLSPPLASPDTYIRQSASALDPEQRFSRVLTFLDKEMSQNSIISLQEVCQNWTEKLHTEFFKRDYTFICRNYGGDFADYMGVAIAFPNKVYNLEEVKIKRISETIQWPRKQVEKRFRFLDLFNVFEVAGIVKNLFKQVKNLFFPVKEEKDPYEDSKRRHNNVIAVKLKPKVNQANANGNQNGNKNQSSKKQKENKDVSFWVANYHMPCAYYLPTVMTMHVSLLLNYLQNIIGTKNKNLILCGDFNIMPDTFQYKLITEKDSVDQSGNDKVNFPFEKVQDGESTKDTENVEKYNFLKQVNFQNISSMRSVYKEKYGKEPDYTNYVLIAAKKEFGKANGNPKVISEEIAKKVEVFKGTLDYIFVSENFAVKDVQKLPDFVEGKTESQPNEKEPSDHLPVISTLEIKN